MKEHNFWQKFSKYLMVGLSALVLLMLVQSGMIGDFTKRGPQLVLADNEDFETVGPANPAFQEGQTPLEETVGPATPAFQEGQTPLDQPAAPAPAPVSQPAPQPVSQPAPQPAFVCPKVDMVDVVEDCFQGSVCKFNVWQGPGANGECINGRGGAFGCRAVPGSCGLPAQPVHPPPQAPARPAPAAPACPTSGAGTALNFGTTTYDRCMDDKGGTSTGGQGNLCSDPAATVFKCEFSLNPACNSGGFIYRCPAPAVQRPPRCNPQTSNQLRCVGNQLCNVNVTVNANNVCGNTVLGNRFNCQNVAGQCGFIPQVNVAPVNITNTNTNTNTVTVNREREVVVREVQASGNVGVGTTVVRVAQARELPKTGLPLLAYAAAAFVPVGFRFRRFSKVREEVASKGHFIWEDRQFKGSIDSS